MKYLACAVAVGLLAIGGCVTESAPDTKNSPNMSAVDMQQYDFPMPATQLVERVKQSLGQMGIGIDQQQGTVLLTTYKTYPGSFHIARRWQEETRYRIAISPDAYDPTRRSHLEITSQTQTRASDADVWHNWSEYQRPQRAAALAQRLHEEIGSGMSSMNPPAESVNSEGNSNPPLPSAPPQPAAPPPPPIAENTAPQPMPADAETVLVTYHVIAGKEDQVAQDAEKAWKIYREANLVLNEPHVIVKETDANGHVNLVEVLTWASHAAPQNVPDAAKRLWSDEQASCEKRDGRPGIDVIEVQPVVPQ